MNAVHPWLLALIAFYYHCANSTPTINKFHQSVHSPLYDDLSQLRRSLKHRSNTEIEQDTQYHNFGVFDAKGRHLLHLMVVKYNRSSCFPHACLNLLEDHFPGYKVQYLGDDMAVVAASAADIEEKHRSGRMRLEGSAISADHAQDDGVLELVDYGLYLPSLKVSRDLASFECSPNQDDDTVVQQDATIGIVAELLPMSRAQHDKFVKIVEVEIHRMLESVGEAGFPGETSVSNLWKFESYHFSPEDCKGCWLYAQWQNIPCQYVPSMVTLLSKMREVFLVERHYPAVATDMWAKGVVETGEVLNAPLTTGTYASWLDGEGEVIGMVDTGIDMQSCFFRDDEVEVQYQRNLSTTVLNPTHRKIMQYITLDSYGDTFDSNDGHGTPNAGLIAGNCIDTTKPIYKRFDGIVPNAKIAIFDANSGEYGASISVPNSLYDSVFVPMYQAGARVFSNPWGNTVSANGSSSSYTTLSKQVDMFMSDYPDALVIFAVGNTGYNSALRTVSPPATAKNVLTVGASSNAHESWNAFDAKFIGSVYDSDMLMGYTGIGPTDDGRLKPDLVAPGCLILSAMGKFNSPEPFCGLQYIDGTSIATSMTAGYVVKVRQYFTKGFYPGGKATTTDSFTPSGALLKAMLVHSGSKLTKRVLSAPDPNAFLGDPFFFDTYQLSTIDYPSIYQGYGRLQINKVLNFGDSSTSPNVSLFVTGGIDKHNDSFLEIEKTSWTREFSVDGMADVRITMVYTDFYTVGGLSSALVNVLTVHCEIGNEVFTPYNASGTTSSDNVQVIDLPKENFTSTKIFTVTVTASSLSRSPQAFSLVVTGATVFLEPSLFPTCPPDTVFQVESGCTTCNPGTLPTTDAESLQSYQCVPCPQNTYNTDGLSTCLACPIGSVTGKVGAASRAECFYILPSIITGFIILGSCVVITIVYFTEGRIYFVMWTRRLYWAIAAVISCGSLIFLTDIIATTQMLLLRSKLIHLRDDSSTKVSMSYFSVAYYLKRIMFVVISFIVTLIVMIVVIFRCMLQVFFGAMIIWRGYKLNFQLPISFTMLISEFTRMVDEIFGVPFYEYLLYPFAFVTDLLATISINLSLTPVNCAGSQAPVFLLVNILVVSFILTMIASDIQMFWRGPLSVSAMKVMSLNLNTMYTSHMLHQCFWNTIASSLILLFPSPVNILQYFIGFVDIYRLVSLEATDACLSAYTIQWDGIISFLCSVFSFLILPPIVFVASQVVMPPRVKNLQTEMKSMPKPENENQQQDIYHSIVAEENEGGIFTVRSEENYPNSNEINDIVVSADQGDSVVQIQILVTNSEEDSSSSSSPTIDAVIQQPRNIISRLYERLESFFSHGKKLIVHTLNVSESNYFIPYFPDIMVNDLICMFSSKLCLSHSSFIAEIWPNLLLQFQGYARNSLTSRRTLKRLQDIQEVMLANKMETIYLPEIIKQDASMVHRGEETEEKIHGDTSQTLLPTVPVVETFTRKSFRKQYLSYSEALTCCNKSSVCCSLDFVRLACCFDSCENITFFKILKAFVKFLIYVLYMFSILPMKTFVLHIPFVPLFWSTGRAVWWGVCHSFSLLFLMSLGIWTDDMEKLLGVVDKHDLLNNLITHNEKLSVQAAEQMRRQSNVAAGLKWKKIDVLNMYQLQDEVDEKEARFRSVLASIVAPRVLLIQLIPGLTLWSVFAMNISHCPVLVFSKKINERLPPLVETSPMMQAYRVLHRTDYPFGLPPLWKVLIVAVNIFLQARLIQFIIAVVTVLVMVCIVFSAPYLLYMVYVMLGLYFVTGLSDALFIVLLIHRYLFPVSQSELLMRRNDSVVSVDLDGDEEEGGDYDGESEGGEEGSSAPRSDDDQSSSSSVDSEPASVVISSSDGQCHVDIH